jgi:hypothetical protein
VDGLSVKYDDQVVFIGLDMFRAEGEAKMRELGMVHHGYAILDRWGNIYWRSAGHDFTPDDLEGKLREALAVPAS